MSSYFEGERQKDKKRRITPFCFQLINHDLKRKLDIKKRKDKKATD